MEKKHQTINELIKKKAEIEKIAANDKMSIDQRVAEDKMKIDHKINLLQMFNENSLYLEETVDGWSVLKLGLQDLSDSDFINFNVLSSKNWSVGEKVVYCWEVEFIREISKNDLLLYVSGSFASSEFEEIMRTLKESHE